MRHIPILELVGAGGINSPSILCKIVGTEDNHFYLSIAGHQHIGYEAIFIVDCKTVDFFSQNQ